MTEANQVAWMVGLMDDVKVVHLEMISAEKSVA